LFSGQTLPPPQPDELANFMRIAVEYGYWMGSPAENAAIGTTLFG
jgi:hypothetical protein